MSKRSCRIVPERRIGPPWRFRKSWKDKSLMFRNLHCLGALFACALVAFSQPQQDRRARIDIDQYTIEADISPNTQSITAKATVRFTAVDDNVTSAAFELNNALNVSKVVD